MKYKLFAAIILALSLIGCDPIYRYALHNSDLYNTKDKNIIYDTDTLKLKVNSDYMQFTKEQATRLDLVVYAKSCDLHAVFFKTELNTDIKV